MVERAPHQVLSPEKQEELDKEKIEEILREHNLSENVELVYEIIKKCKDGGFIDTCCEQAIKEHEKEKKKNEEEDDDEPHKGFGLD